MIKKENQYLTNSAKETQKLGEFFALQFCSEQDFLIDLDRENKKNKNGALVLGLNGDLGSGKTTFLQGFAKGLKIKEKILSPTFIIMKRFEIKTSKFKNFYHIDCYRLKNEKDILGLGFKEIISNPENIVAIEWPEKIKKILSKNTIFIHFKFINEHKREIKI